MFQRFQLSRCRRIVSTGLVYERKKEIIPLLLYCGRAKSKKVIYATPSGLEFSFSDVEKSEQKGKM